MVNLPQARKVDKIKSIPLRKLTKSRPQIQPNATLSEILTNFEAAVCDADGRLQMDNHATAKEVRQLLSSLQALLKRNENGTGNEEQFEETTNSVVKSLSILNSIVTDESGFSETIALSALCMSFIILNYFTSFTSKFPNTSAAAASINPQVWVSCFIYSSYFSRQKNVKTTDLVSAFEMPDLESSIPAKIADTIKRMTSDTVTSTLTFSFREAALISGLFNCAAFHELITQHMLDVFLLLHPLITIRLCSLNTIHEFHILRLLNQYLKAFYGRRKAIEETIKHSYEQLLVELITGTLAQIDHDWESPVYGVGNQIRDAYKSLIELAKEPAVRPGGEAFRKLIADQFQQTLSLPFTCKSKYRKLSTLLQCLASETVDASWFTSGLQTSELPPGATLCELPFLIGEQDSFAAQVVHHMSINSLANSVAEFYKASVGAICTTYKDFNSEEGTINKATAVWSNCWLKALTSIFTGSTSTFSPSLSQSPIVQSALVAHLLPFTLQNVPGSMVILMNAFRRCPYGQIAVVRICLEKCSSSMEAGSLPPASWLLELLAQADDRTRAEALALLVDERLIGRGGGQARQTTRPLVCRLVMRHFLRSNLNIDSAPFRQRVICRLEAFYAKVITSVVDRVGGKKELEELPPTDQEVVHCVRETLDLLAVSLFPGSCYQRKFTALSLFSSIVETLEKEDREDVFARLFCQILKSKTTAPVSWITLLLLGLVDKDDKIRRLTTEVLIEFGNSRLYAHHLLPLMQPPNMVEQIANLGMLFSNSPRHQETHLSGLLEKLPHRWALNIKTERREAMQGLFWAVKKKVEEVSADFYSTQTRNNLLWTAKCRPLHGVLLQLNHLLPLLAFREILLLKKGAEKEEGEDVSSDRLAFCRALLYISLDPSEKFSFPVRSLLQPCIKLTLDVIEFFVDLLTPNSSNGEDDDDDMDPMDQACPPSFLEMDQAIENIISRGRSTEGSAVDTSTDGNVSTSNDFQLLMSLCWLNIKECTFLLTTIAALFADLLSLVVHQEEEEIEGGEGIGADFLVTAEELLSMGSKIVSVMLRSRHKGVIEASGVALSRFTRTMLRIQCLLAQKPSPGQLLRGRRLEKLKADFSGALETFVEKILSAIDFRSDSGEESSIGSTGTSVTRRSAGLALIVQSVLVGEAEAIRNDGLRPIIGCGGGGTSCSYPSTSTLYERVIDLLVSVATSPVSPDWQNQAAICEHQSNQQLVDLPQANALHILQAIVGTSALATHSAKTVERLFPLCVAGFTSPHWQLRNASLTLFGACTTRMLGQKKWIKALDAANAGDNNEGVGAVEGEHLGAGFGTTITFAEFAARYPSLVGVIEGHFAGCQSSASKELHPELVPVLALLASFTPVGEAITTTTSEGANHLPDYLTAYLSNRIWKVRLLAARALATLWSTDQMEKHLFQHLQLDKYEMATAKVDGNTAHGLLCLADNVLQLKMRAFTEGRHMGFYRQRLMGQFASIVRGEWSEMLREIALSVIHPYEFGSEVMMSDVPREKEEGSEDEEMKSISEEKNSNYTSNKKLTSQLLQSIQERVNFKQSDDIRLRAAEQLKTALQTDEPEAIQQELLTNTDGTNLVVLVDVLFILLEDEDRDVRLVGQTVVGLLVDRLDLLDAFPLYRSHPVLNQTTSLDCLFRLLTTHLQAHHRHPLSRAAEETLFGSLLRRLLSSSRLVREDTVELSAMMEKNSAQIRGEKEEVEKEVILLFEREQKNVFAEPYAMAIRIGHYLAVGALSHLPLLQSLLESEEEGKRLAKSCQRLEDLLRGSSLLQTLMGLSIWKLPDFLARVVSLAEILTMLEMLADKHKLLKWSFREEGLRCLELIRAHFLYLETLRRQVLKSTEDDSLLSSSSTT